MSWGKWTRALLPAPACTTQMISPFSKLSEPQFPQVSDVCNDASLMIQVSRRIYSNKGESTLLIIRIVSILVITVSNVNITLTGIATFFHSGNFLCLTCLLCQNLGKISFAQQALTILIDLLWITSLLLFFFRDINSHTIRFNHLKYTIQYFIVLSQSCITITKSNFRTFLFPLKKKTLYSLAFTPILSHPLPLPTVSNQ